MSAREMFFPEGTEFSEAEERAFARDDLIYMVTETLLMAMEDKEISKVELAKRLNKSKSHVSRLLDGSRNMTLASLSDICFALGIQPEVRIPVELPETYQKAPKWSSVQVKPLTIKNKTRYKRAGNVLKVEKAGWTNYNKVA